MNLINEKEIVELFSLPEFVMDKLAVHISTARKKLIQLIGSAKFDELSAAQADDPNRQDASNALAFLSYYYAFPHLGLQPNQNGGFTKQTGFEASQNTLMGVAELEKYRSKLYADALLLLDGMLLADDETEANLGSITFLSI